jgi:hypothetical protein
MDVEKPELGDCIVSLRTRKDQPTVSLFSEKKNIMYTYQPFLLSCSIRIADNEGEVQLVQLEPTSSNSDQEIWTVCVFIRD